MKNDLSSYVFGLLSTISLGQTCGGLSELNGCSGSFEDGSGSSIYSTNLNCAWHIQNDSSKQLILSFDNIDIEWGIDIISVYDGKDANAPLLGQLLDLDDNPIFISSGSDLYVTFTSDNSVSLQGWTAKYSCSNGVIPNVAILDQFSDITFFNDSLYFSTVLVMQDYQESSIGMAYEIKNTPTSTVTDFLHFENHEIVSKSDTLYIRRAFSFDELNLTNGLYSISVEANPSRIFLELKFNDNQYTKEKLSLEYCGGKEYKSCLDTLHIKSDLNSGQIVNASCIYEINPSNLNAKHIELNFDEVELGEGQELEINYKKRGDVFYHNLRFWDNENADFQRFSSPGPIVQVVLNSIHESPVNIKIPYRCIEEDLVDPTPDFITVATEDNNMICSISVGNNSIFWIDSLRIKISVEKLENGIPNGIEKRIVDNYLLNFIAPFVGKRETIVVDVMSLNLDAGEYLVYLDIDPDNLIEELDESNNRSVSHERLIIPFCRLGNFIDECSGTLTDESGSELAPLGTACSWMMKSDDAEHYVINFTDYDFSDEGSKINIYDTGISYNEMIASFNYRNLPYPVASSTGEIKVKFENYTDEEEEGWKLEFSCVQEKRHNFNYHHEYLSYSYFIDRINLEAEIRNASSIGVDDVKIGLYLSTDDNLTKDDYKFHEISFGAFEAYESRYFEFDDFLKPYIDDLETGQYYYGFIIDSDHRFDELLETDNSLISRNTITIGYCNGFNQNNDCTGTITDGSGDNSYLGNLACGFFIQPDYGDKIDLEFTSLNWESPNDSIIVLDFNSPTNLPLAIINNNDTPDAIGVLSSTENEIFLQWHTGDSNPAPEEGWELQYVCKTDKPNLLVRFDGIVESFNKEITLPYILKSDSGHSTGSFDVKFILGSNRFNTFSSIVLDSITVNSMEGSEVQNRNVTLDLSPYLAEIWAGHKYIGVLVDANKDIDEMDESDNLYIYQEPIDVLVSIEELDLSTYLKVFPNPSTGQLNIGWSDISGTDFSSLQIVNALGLKVFELDISSNDNHHQVIDVSSFPAGVYIIKMESDGRAASKTFIKMD